MGGKKSKAPPAPDYAAAAQAQGAADLKTAQYTTALDRPTQIDPYGSTTWQFGGAGAAGASPAQTAAVTNLQAQIKALQSKPITGGKPNDRRIEQQARDRQLAQLNTQLASAQKAVAAAGAARGSPTNPQPGDWRQVTTLTPAEQRIFDAEQANRLGMEGLAKTAIGRAGTVIGQGFNPALAKFDPAQGLKGSNVGLPQLAGDRVGLAQYQGSKTGLPTYAAQQNAPGMGADRVGLTNYTSMGAAPGMKADTYGLQGYQQQANAPGMQADALRAAGYNQQANAPGMGADRIGVAGNTLSGLSDVNESADQFADQGQQVRDAMYRQMTQFSDDRFSRAEQQERSRLAQMGLAEGSEAYKNALSEFNRSKDESYQTAQLNAILAGGGEQSRMIADQLASRQSNIGLRQGQFGQDMARDQQDMAERAQTYGAAANQYGQNQAERQFGFQSGLALDQQDMAERLQSFNAAGSQWDRNQGERQFGFQANVIRDQQEMAERAQQYGAASNQYGQTAAERQFGFQAGMARDQQDMAERAQTYGAAANQYGQNQAERQFGFQAGMDRFGADQSERQFKFGADMSRDQQDMAERLNMFNTGAQRYGMDQGERQAMATSELNLANQAAAQRQQMFNEAAYQRSLPINEISALIGGGGVNMPQFAGFAPSTPFASPDLLGAANAQYGAAMNQYNAGQSQKGGLLSAGAGLAGSIIGK